MPKVRAIARFPLRVGNRGPTAALGDLRPSKGGPCARAAAPREAPAPRNFPAPSDTRPGESLLRSGELCNQPLKPPHPYRAPRSAPPGGAAASGVNNPLL